MKVDLLSSKHQPGRHKSRLATIVVIVSLGRMQLRRGNKASGTTVYIIKIQTNNVFRKLAASHIWRAEIARPHINVACLPRRTSSLRFIHSAFIKNINSCYTILLYQTCLIFISSHFPHLNSANSKLHQLEQTKSFIVKVTVTNKSNQTHLIA